MTRLLSIVLVEDDPEQRLVLRSFLVKKGHTIALEAERGDDPRLWDVTADVAVVDLGLAGASGIDVIDELRERMPVLALTASNHDSSVSEALLKGAVGYVVKGAPMAEVVGAIELVAAHRPVLRRHVDARIRTRST
jgi:DNA-binding NarL/FixJ family response regulator